MVRMLERVLRKHTMKNTTKNAILAILATDETVNPATADHALAVLEGGEMPRPLGRVIRTREAARILGVTTKTLRNWTKAGTLVPVYAGGNKLRTGYTEASVRALAEGGAA
jgi:hypothetical protein